MGIRWRGSVHYGIAPLFLFQCYLFPELPANYIEGVSLAVDRTLGSCGVACALLARLRFQNPGTPLREKEVGYLVNRMFGNADAHSQCYQPLRWIVAD